MKGLAELTERQRLVLKTIVKTYLESGEPVGSRTLSKLPNLDVSPATIRNEMSDLEELGYLISPHTSAGRIPTDKGYRFFVDNLMIEKELEFETFKNEMFQKVDQLENMMKGLVKTLASNTHYAALVSGPVVSNNKIKYVQVSKIENLKLLAVVICEANVIKTSLVSINKNISPDEIVDIQQLLNNMLCGHKPNELVSQDFKKKIDSLKNYKDIINTIIESISDEFNTIEENNDGIYTYGANNFLRYPEISSGNVEELLRTFETKGELKKIIDVDKEDNNQIQIYIGEESSLPAMKDCSIITAKCDFGEGIKGTIGVVGPKRMDYEKVLKTVKGLMNEASKAFKEGH